MKKVFCLILIAVLLVCLTGCYKAPEKEPHKHYCTTQVIKPTCSAEGYTLYSCTSCIYRAKSDIVPPLSEGGHNYVDLVCEYCNDFLSEQAVDTLDLEFEKMVDDEGNESYVVMGVGAEKHRYVKIPSHHEGLPVTKICAEAFKRYKEIPEYIYIIIPDTVTYIGESAFEYCPNLLSIVIPDSVTYVGERAFWDCQKIQSLTIAGLKGPISNFAFVALMSITTLEIPEGVTEIGVSSFADCENLVSITLPSTLEYIYHGAFENCGKLQRIDYNGTVEQWNRITKEVGMYIDSPTNASWDAYTGKYIVHCLDGIVHKMPSNA